jgi:hypothetical protein
MYSGGPGGRVVGRMGAKGTQSAGASLSAAGRLDFHPHVVCANPACRVLYPARLAFRAGDGRVFCGPACARAAGWDHLIEEGRT